GSRSAPQGHCGASRRRSRASERFSGSRRGPGGRYAVRQADRVSSVIRHTDERERKMKRRNNGELENAVLTALWERGEPMAVAELQSAVSAPKPAYTTMMTVLTRMEDKGLITRERVSRSLMISPVRSQAATAASRMSQTLRDSSDSREV